MVPNLHGGSQECLLKFLTEGRVATKASILVTQPLGNITLLAYDEMKGDGGDETSIGTYFVFLSWHSQNGWKGNWYEWIDVQPLRVQ